MHGSTGNIWRSVKQLAVTGIHWSTMVNL